LSGKVNARFSAGEQAELLPLMASIFASCEFYPKAQMAIFQDFENDPKFHISQPVNTEVNLPAVPN
jgi:hypothetical protein